MGSGEHIIKGTYNSLKPISCILSNTIVNILSRVHIIADNMRTYIASKLIRANPLYTGIVNSGSNTGGDF